MPYPTKTLSQLRAEIASDIASELPSTDPLLRFSNLQILGAALAGLVKGLYGYLGYIALQAVPYTATGEWLEAWAAVKGIFRNSAQQASGFINFFGVNGTFIPSGTRVVRGDGHEFKSTADVTIGDTVSGIGGTTGIAIADDSGLTGAWGNMVGGTYLNLEVAISGCNSRATAANTWTGGADLETDDSLRSRMLLAFQTTAHGGDEEDYIQWALAVAGVTRAWCVPHSQGPGTVGIFTMFDSSEAAFGGFPQGTNGVATNETRDTPATGDQLAVANYIFSRQPVTALVYSFAPVAFPINFTISNTSGWSAGVKSAVEAALDALFVADGNIDDQGGTTLVPLSDINAAISGVAGTSGYVLNSPNANVTVPFADLPTRGTMTYNP